LACAGFGSRDVKQQRKVNRECSGLVHHVMWRRWACPFLFGRANRACRGLVGSSANFCFDLCQL
jgi:hypothetical protein